MMKKAGKEPIATVKTTIRLPQPLWRAAHIAALDHNLDHLARYFGREYRAMDITSDRVTAYIADRQEQGAANATINRSLAALKRGFVLAEIAHKVASRPHVALLEEHNRRKGFFEHDDYK